ncbi:UNVERIFIED_CONTAM: Retrovirus-related Pol polyprotein from transposon RE2 [Sesamum calycinum]|uniref:Retrovirus-related Pol polyprotein from transposon RE2 n=1 Tax=Sesamum calycinum TaxID=2727403 RepID=A0AAW2IUJ7_9LAMI
MTSSSQLIQFLTGLSDAYDHVRNQILLMDPLPSIGKAYSMILKVEKQREIHSNAPTFLPNGAMNVRSWGRGKQMASKTIEKRDKRSLLCEHCNKTGHDKESCFKIHGYPDWYKNLMEQRKKGVGAQERAFAAIDDSETSTQRDTDQQLADMIRSEVRRVIQEQTEFVDVNMAEYEDFVGLISLLLYVDDILVTGPYDSHIIEVKRYLDNLFTIKDLGEAKYFLGLEIARTSQGLIVTQTKYVTDLIEDMGLARAKTTTTLLPIGVKFIAEAGGALPNPSQYRRLIGRVLYLGYTRADISHATQQLS